MITMVDRKLLASKRLLAGTAAVVALLALAGAPAAAAEAPLWQLSSTSTPTNLPPGGTGEIVAAVSNLGDAPVNGASTPVSIADVLPAGLSATAIHATVGPNAFFGEPVCELPTPNTGSCTYTGVLAPYETVRIEIAVQVEKDASSGVENALSVTGGGLPDASVSQPVTVNPATAPFQVASFAATPSNEDGSPDTQAGSHPFQMTFDIALNTKIEAGVPVPAALPKDLRFTLPPGLVGNATAIPQCTVLQFATGHENNGANECPGDSAIGVAAPTLVEPNLFGDAPFIFPVPLFNLVPAVGEPARFGFTAFGVPVTIDTSVRSGGDYSVMASVKNIPQTAAFLSSQVTFWGVPGDPRHDQSRGWECVDGGVLGQRLGMPACAPAAQHQPPPFLTLPTSCAQPFKLTVEADPWASPGNFLPARESTLKDSNGQPLGLDGCNRLGFDPSISVAPDGQSASTPTGLTVGLHVPQQTSLAASGLAEAAVEESTVTLPAGVTLNSAAADGLQACSEAQIGFQGIDQATGADLFTPDIPTTPELFCPDASKVATVSIKTPLLAQSLEGAVYLAAQTANPFGSLLAMYIVAEDPVSGVLLKIPGEVSANEQTGQLVSTFKHTPQLPFEDLQLHFFGGSRAPLSTPPLCKGKPAENGMPGEAGYETTASLAPWSQNTPVETSSEFDITSGPNGSQCQNPLPFAPTLAAGATSLQAGGFSPFTLTMSREDGMQELRAIQLHMPPGLLGTLSTVKLCEAAQANAGTCGPDSLIGHATVSVGLGSDPFTVSGGQMFITGPYKGAPFGLSIVTPAKAGPFDLGVDVTRARIEVNPTTATLTITTDASGPYAIPSILKGIPLQIKHVNVTVDRPDFTFNPTNCDQLAITGTLRSTRGATAAVSSPFQVTNCASLAFHPKFSVSTSAHTSRANGASLLAKLVYPSGAPGTQANLAKVKVDLPKQLPSRLTTLQKACTAAVFAANPANCPPASLVGHAKAITPVLPVALTGPVYFVSHGATAFPDLTMVLQGYGITVDVVGTTFISKAGITSSSFKTIPDVPLGSFEVTLPSGKYSALSANGNLCKIKSKLAMPTAFIAQDGAVIHQSTKISVSGCPKAKKVAKKRRRKRRRG
jgi:hypothetical protein